MSDLEREWNSRAWMELLILPELEGWEISNTLYEPITFHVAGLSYTPDFLHLFNSPGAGMGMLCFVEVKGSKYQRDYKYSLSRMKVVAYAYPFFLWILATGKRGRVKGSSLWTLQKIGG